MPLQLLDLLADGGCGQVQLSGLKALLKLCKRGGFEGRKQLKRRRFLHAARVWCIVGLMACIMSCHASLQTQLAWAMAMFDMVRARASG